ncbi:alpha/beta fold hydrolase [Sphingomonas sp.]|uniref:alpha/beta fold hydrolase n=1 Tax=Sphingomonas sp. TaxID=28214 RepID=UPI003B3BA388
MALTLTAPLSTANAQAGAEHPVIVLVHGAFAESGSWNGVISALRADGYQVIAAPNPLRSVKTDAQAVAALASSLKSPIILVGHSYGGAVITDAASLAPNVKALVYVAGFAPDTGESSQGLSAKFPGSTLGPTLLPPVPLADGGQDLYIDPAKFPQQFSADVPLAQAVLMATTQRPITAAALSEPTVVASWKTKPSFFIYGSADRNIPAAVHAFMAKRAGAKKTIVIPGASHVVMISHPKSVADLIEEAASDK